MRILVTNDDGVLSRGLWACARALLPLGEVFVVAPDREQSGVGPALNLQRPVKASRFTPMSEGLQDLTAYVVEGTPGDCVVLALEELVGPVDLVVSGINHGPNTGPAVLMSGTVGGALHGYLKGVNSLAVSLCEVSNPCHDPAVVTVRETASALLKGDLPSPVLLNVNVPSVAPSEVRGALPTRLSLRTSETAVRKDGDGRRTWFWVLTRRAPQVDESEGTDMWAVERKLVSVTPLRHLATDESLLPRLTPLCRRVAEALARSA